MSNEYLLLISIGPIQDFIKEARRTRDLWFGSHALSELSRAAAKALADHGGELIFPALNKGDLELEACGDAVRPETGRPPLSVANKIQAIVSGDPRSAADIARTAVRDRWSEIARVVRGKVSVGLADEIDKIWNEQIETLIEFYATWAPISSDSNDDYANAREQVEQALAGRKNLRDFTQWPEAEARRGAAKSGLDGARVSVLSDDRATHKSFFAKYRISSNEQLDAVGLIKRAGFEPAQFVPIMNVAAAPWLKVVKGSGVFEAALKQLEAACEGRSIGRIDRSLPVTAPFRYDASVFYPDRWRSLFEELSELKGNGDQKFDYKSWGRENVQRPILDKLNELKIRSSPSSYVACLVADGDRMGKALDDLAKSYGFEAHRDFSRHLAEFPGRAREIIESKNHLGSLVYSGGDDVLAFLPVAYALDCAQKLQAEFEKIMKGALRGRTVSEPPTLSVGIGIGHVMESMGTLLDLGREAEREAKKAGRNALAIVFDKRSGGKRNWAAKWNTQPVQRLSEDIGLLSSSLSTGKIYEIGAMLRRFDKLQGASAVPEMLDAFVAGILAQSGRGSESKNLTVTGLDGSGDVASNDFNVRLAWLRKMTERLLVAKELRANGWSGSVLGEGS